MPATNPKEQKLDESELDSSATQAALEEIEACQNEIDSLNEKASEEILTVEQKYNKLRRPYFMKRNGVIQNIPSFWFQAFTNHPMITSLLNQGEEDCLQSLTKVDVEEFADIKSGYKLTFTFKENDFFTNKELVKEFNLTTAGEPDSKSTPIEWKEGKDLTKKLKQANGSKRPLVPPGFFAWFLDNGDPNADEIAELIKDDIWPNPLNYYLAQDIDQTNSEDEFDDSIIDANDDDTPDEEEDDDEEGEDGEGEDDDGEEGDD